MVKETEAKIRVNLGHKSVKFDDEDLIYKGLGEILETSKDSYWCEVLRPDDIVKPMIDLDMKVDCEETMKKDKRQIMKDGRDYVEDIFECDVSDIAISDSCGYDSEKKVWKISFHYVVNGMSVRWGDLKRFDKIKDGPKWVDKGVYIKRAMRMIHCSKTGQDRYLRPVTHKKDPPKHIIQWTTPEDCKNRFVVPGLSPSTSEENVASKDVSYTLNEKEAKLLRLCDPDCDRKTWVEIGMALKGIGVSYQVFEDWSRDSDKFDARDCETQWKSFRMKSKFRINTIYYWAKQHGLTKYNEIRESIYTSLYAESEQRLVEYMNRECVYFEHLGKKSAFMLIDKDGEFCLKDKGGMMDHFEDIDGILDAKGHRLNVFTIWCKSKYRRKCSKMDFYPSDDYKGKNFNVFKGFAVPPEAAVEGDVKAILDHIKYIWCKGDEEQYDYTLNWLAHSIQKPWVKIGVALCLNSKFEGAGKGVIIHKTMAIIGKDHSEQIANDEEIFGNFTGTMSGKCMLNLNEAVWGGSKKNRGLLMNMITEPRTRIRFLNCEAFYETSFHNYIIDSNESWFIPAGPMSRRFFALALDNKFAGKGKEEVRAYFKPIIDTPVEAWADFLHKRDISKFVPQDFPETDLLQEQSQMGLDSLETWFRTIMGEGEMHDELMERSYKFQSWVVREDLFRMYETEMKGGGYQGTWTKNTFFEKLRRMMKDLGSELQDQTSTTDGKKIRKVRFGMKLEEVVVIWNKMRGDNVETNKIKEVDIDELKEANRKKKAALKKMKEEQSELDEGVVV